MSKWASRWPGEYAFKDGPSRRGPDRQHKSTIKPTVALVDHKADDVEKRYREIRLRQKEIERQRRRSFVMEAQAPRPTFSDFASVPADNPFGAPPVGDS